QPKVRSEHHHVKPVLVGLVRPGFEPFQKCHGAEIDRIGGQHRHQAENKQKQEAQPPPHRAHVSLLRRRAAWRDAVSCRGHGLLKMNGSPLKLTDPSRVGYNRKSIGASGVFWGVNSPEPGADGWSRGSSPVRPALPIGNVPTCGQRRAGVPPARRARERERERMAAVGSADGARLAACPALDWVAMLRVALYVFGKSPTESWLWTTTLNASSICSIL